MYAKKELREYLAFKRFLMAKGVSLTSVDTMPLLNEMRRQISSLHSNRGEYDIRDDLDDLIKEYIKINGNGSPEIDLGVTLEEVEELVIIGHSLKTDEDVIYEWLDRMTDLRKVKIFTYFGEPPNEVEEKKVFFSNYDILIETIKY